MLLEEEERARQGWGLWARRGRVLGLEGLGVLQQQRMEGRQHTRRRS